MYFALFSLPVLYVLFKYIPPAMTFVITIIMKDPIFYGTLYTLFFSGTGPLTGFLFFLPMWFFASKLRNPEIKRFIWLTSFGMLLFFTANQQPPLQNKLFPPFGLLSASITGSISLFDIFGNYLYGQVPFECFRLQGIDIQRNCVKTRFSDRLPGLLLKNN